MKKKGLPLLGHNIRDLMAVRDRQRLVRMTISYNAAASERWARETGRSDSNIISPNFVTLPEMLDEIDEAAMPQLRQIWLHSLDQQNPQQTIEKAIGQTRKTAEQKIFDAFNGSASSRTERNIVNAARFPVPESYDVVLPETTDKTLRGEIIETLVPFKKARAMLLRFENGGLDLPLRFVKIGHCAPPVVS